MAAAAATAPDAPSMDAPDDDDEWEYEYDYSQFESHYITIDFTSRVAPEQRRNPPKVKRAKHDLAHAANLPPSTPLASPSSPPSTPDRPPDRLHLLDLPSPHPILRYRNRTYTATWSTAVGTDLLFTLPSESDLPPSLHTLRATADYALLATTSHRLIAHPATLAPRPPSAAPPAPAPAPLASDAARASVHANPARAAQARFLDRLASLKARRAELDPVPTHSAASKDRPLTLVKSRLPGDAAPASAPAPRRASTRPSAGDVRLASRLVGTEGERPAGGPGSRGGPGAFGGTSHLRGYTLGMSRRGRGAGGGGRPRLSTGRSAGTGEGEEVEEGPDADGEGADADGDVAMGDG